jgi:hypothetical protein
MTTEVPASSETFVLVRRNSLMSLTREPPQPIPDSLALAKRANCAGTSLVQPPPPKRWLASSARLDVVARAEALLSGE